MQPVQPPSIPAAASASLPVLELIEPIALQAEPDREKEAEARRRMFFEGARPGGTTLAVVVEEDYDFRPLIKPLLDLDDELLDQLRQCLSQRDECQVFVQSLRELHPRIKPLADLADFLQVIEASMAKKLILQAIEALQPSEDIDDTLFEYLYKQVKARAQDATLFYEWQQKVEEYVNEPGLAQRMTERFTQNTASETFMVMTLFAQIFCLQEANAIEKQLMQPHLSPVFAKFPNIATACAAFVIQEKYGSLLQEMITKAQSITNNSFDHFSEIGKTLHDHIEAVRSLYSATAKERIQLYNVLTNQDIQVHKAYFNRHSDNPTLARIAQLFAKPFGTYLKDILVDFLLAKNSS